MHILVTGGTGFIGGYFVPMLLEKGYNVRLLVRDVEKARKQFGDRVEYHVGDVCDKDSLVGCCDGIEVVFHLVAKSGNDLPTAKNFEIFRKINVKGTENLIEECKNIKKFVYVSSTAAMGLVKDNPINEKSVCYPDLPYQVTKYEVEQLIMEKVKNGFPGIIIRPTKVYGVNEREWSYLTLAKMVKKGCFLKVGSGHNYTSNVYVSDFTQALTRTVENGGVGETYIITSDESIDFIKVGEIIAEELGRKLRVVKIPAWFMIFAASIEEKIFTLLGKKPIVTERNIRMTIQDRVYDISKAKKELGYMPEISMESGIRTVIRWYKEKDCI